MHSMKIVGKKNFVKGGKNPYNKNIYLSLTSIIQGIMHQKNISAKSPNIGTLFANIVRQRRNGRVGAMIRMMQRRANEQKGKCGEKTAGGMNDAHLNCGR